MSPVILIVLAAAIAGASATATAPYRGHKIALVQAEYATLHALRVDVLGAASTHDPALRSSSAINTTAAWWRVHLAPHDVAALEDARVLFRIVNDDVQAGVDQEAALLARIHANPTADWFDSYHTYDDMKQWYNDSAATFPHLVTFVPSIGKSFEGRDIFAVHVTANAGQPHQKPQIFIQSTIHAREWISPATVAYVFNSLVNDFGVDPIVTDLLNRVEFVIVCILNVDGYAYTWSDYRLWRKNRREPPSGSSCYGIDLNRNYNDHFNQGGSSSDPCSDNYHGTGPASELETQASVNYFIAAGRVIGAIDFHSSGQLILRPYGWTYTDAPDEGLSRTIGDAMARAIQNVNGEIYTSQKSIGLYPTSGSASDWFYGEEASTANKRRAYGFTIELRPNTGGQHDIPPDQIKPTGAENYEAVKTFASFCLANPLPFP